MFSDRIRRFARYASVGVSTFALDLALLFLCIDVVGMHYLLGTGVAFFAAASVNYVISRQWVFRHTERTAATGYLFFILFALGGAGLTTALMWLITTHTSLHFALIRILIAGVVGSINYASNLYLNFQVAGKELG